MLKKLISLYEESRYYGLNNDKNQHYHIRVALPEEGLPTRFLCAFRQFRQEYPKSEIMFPFFPFSTHLKAIANGDVDLSIAAEYRPEYIENLTFIPLMRDTYSFLMREENPLSRLPIIHKEDLGTNISSQAATMALLSLSRMHCHLMLKLRNWIMLIIQKPGSKAITEMS